MGCLFVALHMFKIYFRVKLYFSLHLPGPTPPPPPPPSTKTIAVSDITMKLYSSRRYYALARVTVKNQDGKPVSGAVVTGTWSDLVNGTYSGKTNRQGVIQFYSPSTRYRGAFTFTVGNLSANGYVYDPDQNTETTDSISTP